MSIKIAQISDIHWRGSTRHDEYVKAFNELYERLKEDKPDLIVCTGDIYHTKTQGITPEVVKWMVWMFQELGKIAPMRTILGNHDANLANNVRDDVISSIFHAIEDDKNMILYKNSGVYTDPVFDNINWCVFACNDAEGWDKVHPLDKGINIALYHGAISGCKTDIGWVMTTGEEEINFFHGYDYAMLGDIHKNQFLSERESSDGTFKPWIGYPGSLIQQNFGEDTTKGYFVWDIKDKNSWDVDFHELENFQPYLTFPWLGNLVDTKEGILTVLNGKFLKGSRYRILCTMHVSDIEQKQMIEWLNQNEAESVAFKFDVETTVDSIETSSGKIQKTSLRDNPDVIVKLYNDYLNANKDSYPLTDEQKSKAETYVREYMDRLKEADTDAPARNVKWSIKSFHFDNLFKYGEGNSIDFSKLNGIVGILGPNKIGKSSIPGAMTYTLFNATDRGPMKTGYVINQTKSECKGRMHLTIDGCDYVIERTSQRDEPKRKRKINVDTSKTSTSLTITKVLEDGSTIPITDISRDESDKKLRKLIGTAEDFLMTSFSSQGNSDRFLKEGATERKAILSKFLDLDIFKDLCDYAKEDCSQLNGKTKRYMNTQWEQVIEDSEKEISALEVSKIVINSRIDEKKKEIDDLTLWIVQRENEVDFSSIKKAENDLISQERLVESAKTEIANTIEKLKVKQQEFLQLCLKLSQYNYEELEQKAEKLLSIKDSYVSIKNKKDLADVNLEHIEKSVRKLDIVPCGDTYPQCHYIRDSHENKGKVQEQRQEVEALKKEVDTLSDMLKEYIAEKIHDKMKEYKLLLEQKTKMEMVIKSIQERIFSVDINVLISNRDAAKEIYENLKSRLDENLAEQISQKKLLLKECKNELSDFENQKSEILINIGQKKQKLSQAIQDREECQEVLTSLQVYDSVQKAFSKNGIPAMVLKSQLPAINKELESILGSIVDFKITLETDTTSNVMDVYIEDAHNKRVIEVASGMEKFITSIALRVALTNLSSLPRSDIFIIDEGFGSLDEASLPQCLVLLSMLNTYFKTVFIITHVAPAKEIINHSIEVKYDGSHAFVCA